MSRNCLTRLGSFSQPSLPALIGTITWTDRGFGRSVDGIGPTTSRSTRSTTANFLAWSAIVARSDWLSPLGYSYTTMAGSSLLDRNRSVIWRTLVDSASPGNQDAIWLSWTLVSLLASGASTA